MWTELVPVLMPVLVAAGGAAAWWINRADKREDRMIKNLEKQLEEEKARTRAAREDRAMWERRATRWHGQLLENDIAPDPRWGDPV